jgi:hypothetical protein
MPKKSKTKRITKKRVSVNNNNNNININVHTSEKRSKRKTNSSTGQSNSKIRKPVVNLTPQVIYRTEKAYENTDIKNQLVKLQENQAKTRLMLTGATPQPVTLSNPNDESLFNTRLSDYVNKNMSQLTNAVQSNIEAKNKPVVWSDVVETPKKEKQEVKKRGRPPGIKNFLKPVQNQPISLENNRNIETKLETVANEPDEEYNNEEEVFSSSSSSQPIISIPPTPVKDLDKALAIQEYKAVLKEYNLSSKARYTFLDAKEIRKLTEETKRTSIKTTTKFEKPKAIDKKEKLTVFNEV